MVPQIAPEQPAPIIRQVTLVLVVPWTVAVNCRDCPVATCAVVGETVTTIAGVTVTVAEPDLVLSATKVAVTVTCGGFGTAGGAV
jgi:hypothetical protein